MNYNWLYRDVNYIGSIDWKKLRSFYNTTFEEILGWEPTANSTKTESFGNGKLGKLRFDELKRRVDPNRNNKESRVLVFGDSYALSRQVSEENTISHLIGNELNEYIPNYGVGNYGIDQAILRFKKYKSNFTKPKLIMIVVPETLVRMNTIWRHFHETGNIFGFKSRFKYENGMLNLINNPVGSFNDYQNLLLRPIVSNKLLKGDPMFNLRFKGEALNVRNLLSLNRSTYRKITEVIDYYANQEMLKSIDDNNGLSVRMKSNARFTIKCYKNKGLTKIFEKLILSMNEELEGRFFLYIIPQLSDLKIKDNIISEYLNNFSKKYNLNIFYAREIMLKAIVNNENIEDLYVEKGYGGHLNNRGNDIIAKWILGNLK